MGWIDGNCEQMAFCWARPPFRWTLVWPPVLHYLLRAADQPKFWTSPLSWTTTSSIDHNRCAANSPLSSHKVDDNPSVHPSCFPSFLIDSQCGVTQAQVCAARLIRVQLPSSRIHFIQSCGHASKTCTSHPPNRELGQDPSTNTAASRMRSHDCGCFTSAALLHSVRRPRSRT